MTNQLANIWFKQLQMINDSMIKQLTYQLTNKAHTSCKQLAIDWAYIWQTNGQTVGMGISNN